MRVSCSDADTNRILDFFYLLKTIADLKGRLSELPSLEILIKSSRYIFSPYLEL